MADRHSALGTSYARGPHGKPGEPGVRLQEIKGLVLHQVAAWPQTVAQLPAVCCVTVTHVFSRYFALFGGLEFK